MNCIILLQPQVVYRESSSLRVLFSEWLECRVQLKVWMDLSPKFPQSSPTLVMLSFEWLQF